MLYHVHTCTSCITVVPSTLPTSFDDSGGQDGPAPLGSAGQGSSACRILKEFFRGGLVPPLANMPWRTQAGFLRPLPAVQQREHRQALESLLPRLHLQGPVEAADTC